VDELLVRLNEGNVYAQGYADDICLLAEGKFPNTVSGLIQWVLHTVELWCAGLGLSVYPDKTGLVAFTRKRKLTGFFEPRLFGKTLKGSMSVKYLGVILDSRLTWKEHVDVKVKKPQNSMWACRRACGATWGLNPGWFIGSTLLSSVLPSLSHPCYGGLAVRRPAPRGN